MAGFTINKIDYANTATGTQTFRFEYKLWSDPDSAYTLIGTSTVNTAGTLNTPQTVTGLSPATLYYIRAANTCESPLEYYIQTLTTSDIFFLLEGATDYGVNYTASMDIMNGIGNFTNSSISITYDNLPSFCAITEQDWEGQPLYPYIRIFKITVTPTGIGDSGTYNFTVIATDGSATVIQNYSLVVDNLAYVRFNRPFSQPTSRTISVGNSELWTYSATANVNGYASSTSYDNWGEILGGTQLRFTANAIAGQEGNGYVMASIKRTTISDKWSDTIIILTTVNP